MTTLWTVLVVVAVIGVLGNVAMDIYVDVFGG